MAKCWLFHDTLLSLPDIYDLDLNADLVILSACETSDGKLVAGEGVMSLASGFTFAGVPSTISSLWSVSPKTTTELVGSLTRNLRAGMPKDEALYRAKLAYYKKYKPGTLAHGLGKVHPFYWAAFVHMGNRGRILKPGAALVHNFLYRLFSK